MPELTFKERLNIRLRFKNETGIKPMHGNGKTFDKDYTEWLERKVLEAEERRKDNPSIH